MGEHKLGTQLGLQGAHLLCLCAVQPRTGRCAAAAAVVKQPPPVAWPLFPACVPPVGCTLWIQLVLRCSGNALVVFKLAPASSVPLLPGRCMLVGAGAEGECCKRALERFWQSRSRQRRCAPHQSTAAAAAAASVPAVAVPADAPPRGAVLLAL
eukprot:1158556-Pelagomonas_calceolata.AAC.13